MAKKIKFRKFDEDDAKRLIRDFVRQLERTGTPEAERTLEIYRVMRRTEDGEARTSLSQQLEVVACTRWQAVMICPTTKQITPTNKRVCRKRFLCVNCHNWRLTGRNGQLQQWLVGIRQALRRKDFHLGPVQCLRWELPYLTRDDLTRFDKFIKQTFTLWLSNQGVEEDDWMLCRVFDPSRNEVRAVYLGPPVTFDGQLATSSLVLAGGTSPLVADSTKDLLATTGLVPPKMGIKLPKGGQSTPWHPSECGQTYLLDDLNRNWGEPDVFASRLEQCVKWCVGDSSDLLRLKPEQAWQLFSRFNSARLFSARGILYLDRERKKRLAIPREWSPTLQVWKQYEDGTTDMIARFAVALLGAGEMLCMKCKLPICDHERTAVPIEKDTGDNDGAPATPPAKVN